MNEYSTELRIPQDRVAVLVGKKGSTKRSFERKTGTKIHVSKEGDVVISGDDSVVMYDVSNVVRAVGRGFNPEVALLLLGEEMMLEMVDMRDFSKNSKKRLARMKSRLIGRKGLAWKMLESLTDTHLSVYGRTVALIGHLNEVMIAKQAVERLLQGSPHGNVYRFIQNQRKAQPL